MRYTFYILIMTAIIISCKEKEIKTDATQNMGIKQDSVLIKDYGGRKSIHQQEWEEHQIESVVDSI